MGMHGEVEPSEPCVLDLLHSRLGLAIDNHVPSGVTGTRNILEKDLIEFIIRYYWLVRFLSMVVR